MAAIHFTLNTTSRRARAVSALTAIEARNGATSVSAPHS